MSHEQVYMLNKVKDSELDFNLTILDILNDLVVDDFDIKNLTIIDKFNILFVLRISCIGETLKISGDKDKSEISINLVSWIDKLESLFYRNYSLVKYYESIKFDFNLPSIEKEILFSKAFLFLEKQDDGVDFFYNKCLPLFLNSIFVNSKSFMIEKKEDVFSFLEILNKVPYDFLQGIENHYQDVFTQNINLENIDILEEKIDFNIFSINSFIKLLFGLDSKSYFEELYYLSKMGKINPNYVTKLTTNEKNVLVDLLIEENKKANKGDDKTMEVDPFTDSNSM